jgi:lysyl-tRNA synthetase class II
LRIGARREARIGIDRRCVMLPGQDSIRDVILFPQLKPRV